MVYEVPVEGITLEKVVTMKNTGKPARVLSITSGKGGVGKTHTTVNLGLALAKEGNRVLILDADLGLANVNILLGFRPQATLHDVVTGKSSINEILVQYTENLHIIPAASGIPELAELNEEDRIMLIGAFDQFAAEYDYLLVDTGAGIGPNVLYFNLAAEEILVIIDPEPTSITDAYALIKVMATQWDTKEFNVIVNRAPAGSDGRATYAKLAAATDKFLPVSLRFLGAISEDESLVQAVMKQKPLLTLFPSSKASRDIMRLAKKISAKEGARTPKGGIQFFFRAILENQPPS